MPMKESLQVFRHACRMCDPVHFVMSLTLIVVVAGPAFSADRRNDGTKEGQGTRVIMIPVSSLASENATTTVSVLRDAIVPANRLLDFCEPDQKHPQGEKGETDKQSKVICQLLEGFVKQLDTPRNEFQASDYLVTIPLKQPYDGVEAVTWTSKNLEGAIAFMDVVQGGRLKGVNVSSSSGSSINEREKQSCLACPIKDLIFHAASISEHKEFLEGREP